MHPFTPYRDVYASLRMFVPRCEVCSRPQRGHLRAQLIDRLVGRDVRR